MFMTYSTSCYHFEDLRIHEVYFGMCVSCVSNCPILYSWKNKIIFLQHKFSQPGYALHLGRSGVYLVFGMQKTLVFVRRKNFSCYSLWPEYVRQRIKDTYLYFGGSIALTAVTAASAFRSPALMRFMTRSSFLVSITRNYCCYSKSKSVQ